MENVENVNDSVGKGSKECVGDNEAATWIWLVKNEKVSTSRISFIAGGFQNATPLINGGPLYIELTPMNLRKISLNHWGLFAAVRIHETANTAADTDRASPQPSLLFQTLLMTPDF